MNYRDHAPVEWNAHWDAMPNSVRQLYATVALKAFPLIRKEIKVKGWGQLCFDEAAGRMTAYHLYNYFPAHGAGWKMISWRVDMDGPCVGGAKPNGSGVESFEKQMHEFRTDPYYRR